ncbi:hypothetical protein FOVG_13986 [Fusarium oxysporum f. sp. pisi HDV247]|uniref:Uncharacterized protein n=3 Tax=Fusarium oxysporum TaxID=5507 RepID=X0KX95_FUSOX|nr:hypothetical protein FOVG_13986 [Fusarium oxysporum f. sp. pisi HDV247]EXM18269.1 hypothetical protein FOTG_13689 [Fusarium oxysporum f. sp. vasinfectum 25433]
MQSSSHRKIISRKLCFSIHHPDGTSKNLADLVEWTHDCRWPESFIDSKIGIDIKASTPLGGSDLNL